MIAYMKVNAPTANRALGNESGMETLRIGTVNGNSQDAVSIIFNPRLSMMLL